MARTKIKTILLLTSTTLARVDLRGTGDRTQVIGVWSRPRQESASIGDLVEAAFRSGGKTHGDIFVLSTSFWTGPVSLAREITAGLSDEDIAQSIALEAESFSGIPAFDSQIAHSSISPDAVGNLRWWVTQLDLGELAQIEDTIKKLGGRLAGVGHPAVVPMTPPAESTTGWRSVQWWGEQTLLARGQRTAISDLQILSAGRQSQRARMELDEFLAEGTGESGFGEADHPGDAQGTRLEWIDETATPDELLTGLAEFSEVDATRVNEEDGLKRWAVAWLSSRSGDAVPCPTVTLPKPPMTKEASIAISVAAGLAAICLCFVHYSFVGGQVSNIREDVAAMSAAVEHVDLETKRLATLQKKTKETREAVEERRSANAELASRLDRAETLMQRQQDRWVALVDALSKSGDPDSWIRELSGEDGAAVVHGFATDNEAVQRFTSRLERHIDGNGWHVQPAQTVTDPSRLIAFSVAIAFEGESMPRAIVSTSDVPLKTENRARIVPPEAGRPSPANPPSGNPAPVTSAPSKSVAFTEGEGE